MRKLLYILILLLLLPLTMEAKKKKTAPAPKKTPYEKILDEAGEHKAVGNFVSLYRIKDKVYVDYPLKYLMRSVLIGATVAKSSNSQIAMTGYKHNEPMHVSFELSDSTIFLTKVLTHMQVDSTYDIAMDRSCNNPIYATYPVIGYSKDSTSVLFDMTKLFVSNKEELSPLAKNYSILKVSATPKKDLTTVSRVRAFDNNASLDVYQSYDYSLSLLGTEVSKGIVSAMVTYTMLLLPEEPMKRRISDSRIGVFLSEKTCIKPNIDGMVFESVANRWRLEPKDTAAWLRGELTEPVKPIVWYVDDAFPKGWIEPLKQSVLKWNEAFEKIGFKNVMIARNFPTKEEDPNFDPNNLVYSCIRYVPIPVQNAQGPSWVDPRSGEIINASVMVYNDVIRLINNWRFVQTAQIDPRVRASQMPVDVRNEALTYVFSHEIGHTLGLMHNMGASSAIPVDSLRSATFTQKYGTTPSIMDYARWNYVAQPEDKGVRVAPPDMGVYDEYAIKWLYSPIPGNKTPEEEQKILERWIDEKADDPYYRYGRQQVYSRYDPSALEEDLGDDPIKAGEYGIKNLKYILSHMNEWIKDDSAYVHRRELYKEIVGQYNQYLSNVLENVGGIRLTEVKEGAKTPQHESIDADTQHRSLLWVANQLRNSDWLDCPELTSHFPMAVKMSVTLANSTGKQMLDRSSNVLLSSHVATGKAYTQKDYFNDIYTAIWTSTIAGKKLTQGEKLLQRAAVNICAGKVSQLRGTKKSFSNTSIEDVVTYNLDPTGYVAENFLQLQKLEEQQGEGLIASLLPHTDGCGGHISFGEERDYGLQHEVTTDMLDEGTAYNLEMLKKIKSLLKSKAGSANAADKAHYQALLMQVTEATE